MSPIELLFQVLSGIVGWGSAWLGADLLSLQYHGNPDPLRQPRPLEFLARAIGRLTPFYLTLAVSQALLLGIYASRSLLTLLTRHEPFIDSSAELSIWLASLVMTAVASGLPSFALAALLSVAYRCPHRWIITPFAVLVGNSALLSAARLTTGNQLETLLSPYQSVLQDPDWFSWLVLAPNLSACVWSGGALYLRLSLTDTLLNEPASDDFVINCAPYWLGAMMFLMLSLIVCSLLWWIAAQRWRRGGRTSDSELSALPTHEAS